MGNEALGEGLIRHNAGVPRGGSTNVSGPSDSELVERCRAGDADAWRALTLRYSDLAFSIARRSGLDRDMAGDVVQEVFLGLLKNLGRLKQTDRLVAWIAQTARRESWRQGRRRRASRTREEQVARPERSPEPLPTGELATLEEGEAVRAAYQHIGERCRRLLDALFVEHTKRSYQDIAEDLDMAVGSIGPTRQRCLSELREALGRLGFTEESYEER